MTIRLKNGSMQLALLPERGGCVDSLTFKGENILRPATAAAHTETRPLETAGFALFPFSGRIANGQFEWHGRQIQLKPNFPPEPHAIHGHSWQAVWQAEETSVDMARLVYTHLPGDWPWAYRAEQLFRLLPDGLELTLTLTNLSDETMPAGIGWHPYFPRMNAQIELPVTGVWQSDADMIPSALAPLEEATDLRTSRQVDSVVLDNAFTTYPAHARINWPGRNLSVVMSSDDIFTHVVVFAPQAQDFFCVEPVSHAPDAINSAHAHHVTGLVSLAPDASLSGKIHLAVQET